MKYRVLRGICGVLAVIMLAATGMAALAGQESAKVRVGALKGPTAMGLAQMMTVNSEAYELSLVGAPDEMVAQIASGQVDIAALPTNLAATLYNKTSGGVKLLALNTLGVLYVLERGDSVHSAADLAGKTLYATGQGATPEYTLRYVLEQEGIAEQTQVEFKAEHTELVTLAATGGADLVLLPEPHVTSLLMQDAGFRVALDMTTAFAEAARKAGEENMELSMGCWVVRTEFAQEHPEAVREFLAAYQTSAAYVNEHVEESAQWIEQLGILPKAAVAAKALPNCHIVCIAGEEARARMEPLLGVWFAANPAAVGGALPGEDFYYVDPAGDAQGNAAQ